MKSVLRLALCLGVLTALAGCTNMPAQSAGQWDYRPYDAAVRGEGESGFLGPANQAVDQLNHQLEGRGSLPMGRSLLVATPQNIDDLQRVSPFGLALGEIIQSRFVQHGHRVTEVKAQDRLRVNAAGELFLSRDIQDLAARQNAEAIVVGTWSESDALVYVTLKAIRVSDGLILGSTSFPLRQSGRLPSL